MVLTYLPGGSRSSTDLASFILLNVARAGGWVSVCLTKLLLRSFCRTKDKKLTWGKTLALKGSLLALNDRFATYWLYDLS